MLVVCLPVTQCHQALAIRGQGKCALRTVVLTGPLYKQFDLGLVKRVDLVGSVSAEFRLDALNVFNNVNFIPVTGITIPATTDRINGNRSAGASQSAYEISQQVATTQARVVQIVSRIRW